MIKHIWLKNCIFFQFLSTLTGPQVPIYDFVLLTFGALLEPDPINWFPRWSSGKFMLLLWSFFSLFITMFYNCNLRANLIAVDYEKPVDSANDILDRGQTIYMPRDIPQFW